MIEKQFTALLRSFVQDTAPKTEEHFSLALRVYTPDEQTIRGEWEPPVLERI